MTDALRVVVGYTELQSVGCIASITRAYRESIANTIVHHDVRRIIIVRKRR